MAQPPRPWFFYIVQNGMRTYAGISPDPKRRLRQHNGELVGGAKYTLSVGPGWEHVCLVRGFRTNIEAMQFEWAVKHEPPRRTGGPAARIRKLYAVLSKERWTSRAPPSADVPLLLTWCKRQPAKEGLVLPAWVREECSLEHPQPH